MYIMTQTIIGNSERGGKHKAKAVPRDWAASVRVGGIIMYRGILVGRVAAGMLVSPCHLRSHSRSFRGGGGRKQTGLCEPPAFMAATVLLSL
jgi:hypothetical protein